MWRRLKDGRRAELAQALTALGLEHWPSEANFILTAHRGRALARFVKAMRGARGILTTLTRSADPGLRTGLVRITVGDGASRCRAGARGDLKDH